MFDVKNLPKFGGLVDLGLHSFRDERGSIRNLCEFEVGSVAIITSEPNTVRSNHWHKTDWHLLSTLEGHWTYQECAPDEDIEKAEKIHVGPFDTVFTPAGRLHRCTFRDHTVLVSLSRLTRTHENHEGDVVRLETET